MVQLSCCTNTNDHDLNMHCLTIGWVKLTAKIAAVPPSAMDSNKPAFFASDMVSLEEVPLAEAANKAIVDCCVGLTGTLPRYSTSTSPHQFTNFASVRFRLRHFKRNPFLSNPPTSTPNEAPKRGLQRATQRGIALVVPEILLLPYCT